MLQSKFIYFDEISMNVEVFAYFIRLFTFSQALAYYGRSGSDIVRLKQF